MKKILFVSLAAIILATMTSNAEIPNLLGNWTGSWNGYSKEDGQVNATYGGINFTVLEQKGRIFAGNLIINFKNETTNEGFAGAIGLDNKTFYLAEFDEGYAFGTVISSDKIEYIYLADGENASVAIDGLHRIPT